MKTTHGAALTHVKRDYRRTNFQEERIVVSSFGDYHT